MLALVIIGYTLLVVFEFIPLYKQKLRRDFWADVVMGVLSFTIAVLISLDVDIPSPVKPIRELITTIFGK